MSKRKPEQPVAASPSPSPSPEPTEKKRKFKKDEIPEDEKLEVDVSLPEPPSKKAKRAEKKKDKSKTKTKSDGKAQPAPATAEYSKEAISKLDNAAPDSTEDKPNAAVPQRSEYGIWIGNLSFSTTKETLRRFLDEQGEILEEDIVRLHMPAPNERGGGGDSRAVKAQNKGFAYVDFTTQSVLDKALALSEKLLVGRRVLIKNAKSFEGRPDKPKGDAAGGEGAGEGGKTGKKEPAKRVFVGNLSFDVTKEDLEEHFGQAGEIEDIHMATFEDSGKCKGYGWIRFKEIEAADAAVKGFVYKMADAESEDDDAAADSDEQAARKKKKGSKRHKQHINRLHGRELRCEFAEDAQTRYKKRYGKGSAANAEPQRDRRDTSHGDATQSTGGGGVDEATDGLARAQKRHDKDQRRKERRKRHERIDARSIAPGQALASAPRNSGAIVAGAGKKTSFE